MPREPVHPCLSLNARRIEKAFHAATLQQFPGAGFAGLRVQVGHGRDVNEMLGLAPEV